MDQVRISCLVIYLLSFSVSPARTQSDLVSIQSVPAYQTQRPCMQSCLYGGCNAYYVDIGCLIGCGRDVGGNYLNACYCRTDLAPTASSLISSCATASCGGGAAYDASAGVSLYASYCHIVFSADTSSASIITVGSPGATTTQLTSGRQTSNPIPPTASTISMITAVVTSVINEATATAGGGTNNGQPLRSSDIIAIVMGVLAALATLLAAYCGRSVVIRMVRDNISHL